MRIGTSLIALVLLATACASQLTSTSPSASASASLPIPSASASPPAPDALTGTWATGETTCAEQNAAVEAAGFTSEQMSAGGWDPTCAEESPHGSQFTIRFVDGALVAFADDEVSWEGVYRIVDEDTFQAGDNGNLYITYQFTIDGDQLTIDMVEDNYPVEAEVIGDSLAQTVIYESAPFTREP